MPEAPAVQIVLRDPVPAVATVENYFDLYEESKGLRDAEQVRRVVVDAVADEDAFSLSLPRRMIEELGLHRWRTHRRRTDAGVVSTESFGLVRLTIQGRCCHTDVDVAGDDDPVRIGRLPLLMLDWVVDPVGRRLIGNPAHGGEWVMEMY
jgi:hypothetical protein